MKIDAATDWIVLESESRIEAIVLGQLLKREAVLSNGKFCGAIQFPVKIGGPPMKAEPYVPSFRLRIDFREKERTIAGSPKVDPPAPDRWRVWAIRRDGIGGLNGWKTWKRGSFRECKAEAKEMARHDEDSAVPSYLYWVQPESE